MAHMANEENLIPFTSDQSREEAKKNGRKGGIKSGESRRRKKAVREVVELIASQPVTNSKLKKMVRTFCDGLDDDDIDMMTAATMGLFQSAIKGNEKAWKLISEYQDQAVIDDEIPEDELSKSLRELGESL